MRWDTLGTEFNEETASYAIKTYGLKVFPGDIARHKLPTGNIDVININQVLEHLKNPNKAIQESYRFRTTSDRRPEQVLEDAHYSRLGGRARYWPRRHRNAIRAPRGIPASATL